MAFNALEYPRSGFNFENYHRNARLESEGFPSLKARKTGTTIVGIKFKDGVILGADTRATEDTIVSDKNCSKIHFLADNIYCCGAGTAADTEKTTRMVSSNLELHRLNTGRGLRVVTPNRMLSQMLFRYQGHIGAALIVGGVDIEGSHLYSIYPHGSSNELPYVTMGSGSLAAMAVFERGWRDELPLEEGMKLVRNAVAAGIFNDLGSGSNVDLCIITKDKTEHLRPYDLANIRGQRQGNYRYKKGATSTLKIRQVPLVVERTTIKRLDVQEEPQTSESMETETA